MIGVFDSGYGGLTVLRSFVDAAPNRLFLFYGDHACAPYGNRAQEEIYRLTKEAVERLFNLGCRLVVLACNTAASTSLRRLQQEWLPARYPQRRILGVVVPMVEAISGVSWMADLPVATTQGKARTVAIFATRQTVLSNAYPVEIGKRAPKVAVVQQACPRLAGIIEAGAPESELRALVRGYVAELMEKLGNRPPEVVMLACTHYPLVANLFAEALPVCVEILSQPDLSARSLTAYLRRHPEFDAHGGGEAVQFLTSGDPERVARLGPAFFGRPTAFKQIEVRSLAATAFA